MKKLFILLKSPYFIPVFLFLFSFLIYLKNLSPSVFGGDVGDLATAIISKGVPHPSGYPLFTMLGIFFNSLPISQSPIWKIGIISSISSSMAVVLMYLIIFELTKNKILSLITSLILAFTYTFWLFAEIAELFALNNFFILLLFYLSILYFKKRKIKHLFLLSFFSGLSLTNHEVIVLIFPSLLFLIFYKNIKLIKKFKLILVSLLIFLAGLIPYLYIPIASSHNPIVNWGHVNSLGSFIRLVLRQDYGWNQSFFKSYDYSALFSLKAYFDYLLIELPLVLIMFAFLGVVSLIREKKDKFFFIPIILCFFLSGPIFVFYSNSPSFSTFYLGVLERFFGISIIFLIMLFPFGIKFIIELIMSMLKHISPVFAQRKIYPTLFSLVFVAIPISLFFNNLEKTNFSNVFWGDDYARDALISMPKDSLFFPLGDTMVFNTLYLQNAFNFRKDVNIPALLLYGNDPKFKSKRKEIMKKKVSPKEADELTLISMSDPNKIYIGDSLYFPKIKDNFKNFVLLPHGLIFKIEDKSKIPNKEDYYNEQVKLWKSYSFPKNKKVSSSADRALILQEIPAIYSQRAYETGLFFGSYYKDLEKAKTFFEKAIKISPNEKTGYEGMGYYYLGKEECKKAEGMLMEALNIDPNSKNAYNLLYYTYLDCFKDKEKARIIESRR